MKKMSCAIGGFVLCALSVVAAQAQSGSAYLQHNVLCQNAERSILITKDLKQAYVNQAGRTSQHTVHYGSHSGGRGQILSFTIAGIDGHDEDTTIRDILALSEGPVLATRARQDMYTSTIIEKFKCGFTR